MPTYRYACDECGDYLIWESIHEDAHTHCPTCENPVVRVISVPALYGVGDRGRETRETDAANRTLSKDLPAYRRLRHQGMQPQGINGCDKLEATATSAMEVNSGGRIKGSETEIKAAMELARDIGHGRA